MPTEKIKYKVDNGIAYIIVNNPSKMNILDFDVYRGLIESFDAVDEDDEVRVAILSGEGDKAFICGQDIATFDIHSIRDGKRFLRFCTKLFVRAEALSKPLIAAVNGLALGGGTEITLACDMTVASDKAKFGLPETGIGVVPLWGVIRLAHVVGRIKAKELMMTGDIISAEEALRIGLINKVAPHGEVLEAAREMAQKILTKAPLAVELAKITVNRDLLPEGYAYTSGTNLLFFDTDDLKEGLDAFFNKRKPAFRGA
ncbi:MAG: enoyl-CoA hydratase-related protein [Syntrophorhabdales bacterium]|jgi:enoyl-CoA hydratase